MKNEEDKYIEVKFLESDIIWGKILKILFSRIDQGPVNIADFSLAMAKVRISHKESKEILKFLLKVGIIKKKGGGNTTTQILKKKEREE